MDKSVGGIDMGKIKLILGASILLLVSAQVSASIIRFSTISTTADSGLYALVLSDFNSAEAEILRDEYFSGDFLNAEDFSTEQSYPLTPRSLVDLRGLGERFNGTFYITEVTHQISDSESGYETIFLIQRDQAPLVDRSGNTDISLLLSDIRFGSYTTTQEGTQISGVTFSAVPEPPALLLFGTGLLGLIGVKWRRKAA